MGIEVREVRPDEYEEAGTVTALAYREFASPEEDDWDEYFDRMTDVAGRAKKGAVLVAVEDGRILGTLTLELDRRIDQDHAPLEPGQAHIRMLGVHPEARRGGAGRALMWGAIERARAEGKERLTLNTTQRMQAAKAMYESLGFDRGPDRIEDDGFVLYSYSLKL
ncbi:MAG: GNAT family N-acetyltransferase [Actinomycetota bacterium]